MMELEMKKLIELYEHGLYSKPFYASRIPSIESFFSYEAFCDIPFMNKQSIRESSIWDRTNSSMEDIYGVFSSNGTTGSKTFYIYNNNDKTVYKKFVRTFFDELEINHKDIGAIMAPVSTGVMAHAMLWQFETVGAGYVLCPEPSPQNIIDLIEKVPVSVIATRPTVATNVAYFPEYIDKVRTSSVKKLAMGGGFLSQERRKLLERVWDAECYNLFGMSEVFGPMAAECKHKNGLHYLDQYLMIEIIDPETKKPVLKGTPGVAVYTTLWAKGFPLLRYWTDDVMVLDDSSCPCGSLTPRLFYKGRLADHFRVNDRYVFPEEVENILFSHKLIGDYQVILKDNCYTVYTECPYDFDLTTATQQLEKLFESTVTLQMVEPGTLGYKGFGNRFEVR